MTIIHVTVQLTGNPIHSLVNFEIIIDEALQSLIDSGENVEAGIIVKMIRKSGDENENDEEIIQETLEKIDLQGLPWYFIRHPIFLRIKILNYFLTIG